MVADKYTIQAETLMKAAIEDYIEILSEVKASDANLTTIKGIRINIQGKPRRLVDVGDIKKTDDTYYIFYDGDRKSGNVRFRYRSTFKKILMDLYQFFLN